LPVETAWRMHISTPPSIPLLLHEEKKTNKTKQKKKQSRERNGPFLGLFNLPIDFEMVTDSYGVWVPSDKVCILLSRQEIE
jgi:hypothetical protein